MWLLVATAIAGIAAAILVLIFSTSGEHPTMRTLRCSMGFFVAIIWIMAIADEVVGVLKVGHRSQFTSRATVLIPWIPQAFGFIIGLSDAIIGLTIFAVGNSLADFVANMSVAVSSSVPSPQRAVFTYLLRFLPPSWDSPLASVVLCSTFSSEWASQAPTSFHTLANHTIFLSHQHSLPMVSVYWRYWSRQLWWYR